MSLLRRAASRDANEPEVISIFKAHGWSVLSLSATGVPDLLVAKNHRTFLVEIVGPAKLAKYRKTRGLNPAQIEFHRSWGGDIFVVHEAHEAQAIARYESVTYENQS